MTTQGLPDLYGPLEGNGFTIYAPYAGSDQYLFLPAALRLAQTSQSVPQLTIEMVRGENPLLPPTPYGMLDCRLQLVLPMAEALDFLRQYHPLATLVPASFASLGYLRFEPLANIPADLCQPMPLVWDGAGTARLLARLGSEGTSALKQTLEQGLLGAQVAIEVELPGVAPRLPLTVRVSTASLWSDLIALANRRGELPWSALLSYFLRDPGTLPLTVEGEHPVAERRAFAEALSYQVRTHCAQFIPAPELNAGPYLRLNAAPTDTSWLWDLSQPLSVSQPIMLRLNPFTAVQEFVRTRGVAPLLKESTVPPVNTGFRRIAIATNLAPNPVGISDLGVTIRIEPKLPQRPQAQVKTVSLRRAGGNLSSIDLRFAANEVPEYEFFTYVVFQDKRGIRQLEGPKERASYDTLLLNLAHFPVTFLTLQAKASLLELAEVKVSSRWTEDGVALTNNIVLTSQQDTVTLLLPATADNATLSIEAQARDGSGVLKAGPVPARSMKLDCYAFRESGVQRTNVECVVPDGHAPVVVEFQAEDSSDIKQLFFTSTSPAKTWVWQPVSPFKCRYRYRSASANGAWSGYCSPFDPLKMVIEA